MDYSFDAFQYGMFIPFILIALFGVFAIVAYLFHSKRKKELAEFAIGNDWFFSSYDPFKIPETYACFDCIAEGHSREAYNVIWGKSGKLDFKAFDYKYTTGSGKNESTYNLSAIIIDTQILFRRLLIRPEGFLDRVAGALGFEDIDFEWDEFNRKFYVKSQDKKFAYDVINQKMMELLVANQGWSLEMSGLSVILYNGSNFSKEQIQEGLAFIDAFFNCLPDYLVQKLRDGV